METNNRPCRPHQGPRTVRPATCASRHFGDCRARRRPRPPRSRFCHWKPGRGLPTP